MDQRLGEVEKTVDFCLAQIGKKIAAFESRMAASDENTNMNLTTFESHMETSDETTTTKLADLESLANGTEKKLAKELKNLEEETTAKMMEMLAIWER
jgi:hypothetical protein